MTEKRTLTPVGTPPTSGNSTAPTVAQALFALSRVERKPSPSLPPTERPYMSDVEWAKAIYCAERGSTRL